MNLADYEYYSLLVEDNPFVFKSTKEFYERQARRRSKSKYLTDNTKLPPKAIKEIPASNPAPTYSEASEIPSDTNILPKETVSESDEILSNKNHTATESEPQSMEATKALDKPSEEADHIIKINIYNINGNSNEFAIPPPPPEITCSEGTLEDIKHEDVYRIVSMLKNLSAEDLINLPEINIPIYIFNITNTLTNGNKNEIKY